MPVECCVCKRAPDTHGVNLHRQNPKGEIGIWCCDDCNTKPLDPEIEEIVKIISPNPPKLKGFKYNQ